MKYLHAIPALPVLSIANSLPFYRDQLGFLVNHEWEGFAILKADDIVLHLWQASDESWKTHKPLTGCPVRSGAESFLAGTASCRIQVVEIDRLHQQLKPLGIIHPNAPLHDTEWGTREFAVLDPDRNLIEFFERLAQTVQQ